MSWHLSKDPGRAGLPLDRWPPKDRLAWEEAKALRLSPFRKHGGTRHAPDTVLKSEKGLRRWLGFLHRTNQLGTDVAPRQRLTPENLDAYFDHLLTCGNAGRSVLGRFEELKAAFELMLPGQRFGWLTHPDGTALHSLLEMRARPRFVPGSAEVLAWAEDLFRTGIALDDRELRCCQVRDAVLIGILATRAPRLRALSSLRLGVHLHRVAAEWLMDQHADITKTGKPLLLPLAAEIGTMLDRYIGTERMELLRGGAYDAVWIGRHGTPLKKGPLAGRIWRLSERRFGVAFGPHRLRASLTTTSALENPDQPFDAPAILGHSAAISLKHYNRATAVAASRRQGNRLQQLRRESEHLARQAYGYDLTDLRSF
jgi:integrase/recombinase XerD